jgi:peptidoglycan hydrolase-like protein with peptidoglycan-binding domain
MTTIKAVITRVAVPLAGAAVLACTVGTGTADARVGAPYIRLGSQGPGVVCVQQLLNNIGAASLAVDGRDGPLTTAGVKVYQSWFGFNQDGIVGPQTGSQMWINTQGYGVPASCYNDLPTYH